MRAPLNKSPGNIERIRKLRKSPSKSETRMWRVLRRLNMGVKFRRQHPIGPYSLDFYSPEIALCIEVDGPQHIAEKDQRRDEFLSSLGIRTARVRSLYLFEKDNLLGDYLAEIIRSRRIELSQDASDEG